MEVLIKDTFKTIEKSGNRKIGDMSCTWVTLDTCPNTCFLKKSGTCYTLSGPAGIHVSKMNKAAKSIRGKDSDYDFKIKLARQEANGIKKLSGKKPLRIHVSGDSSTTRGTRLLAQAAKVYKSKHNQPVYSYTHYHKTKRSDWGEISILRSCETLEQAEKAHSDGFASSMVVSEFKSEKAYDLGNGFKGIPCPEQTGKQENCVKCGLCMKDTLLHKNKMVILFAAHGSGTKKIKKLLTVINEN